METFLLQTQIMSMSLKLYSEALLKEKVLKKIFPGTDRTSGSGKQRIALSDQMGDDDAELHQLPLDAIDGIDGRTKL